VGRYDVEIFSDGIFRLDGGSMFGVVTKVLWERAKPADERNRIAMDMHCLLIRDGAGLESALDEIEAIEAEAATVAVPGGPEYNLAWQDWLNLRNMATTARLIARSALERRESRGSHYRQDFPEPDPAWLVNVLVQAKDGGVSVWTESVRFTRLSPEPQRAEPASVEIGD
jgi:succinate dehydrogenase/fumarate reductase flavoprotein subunit